MALEAVAFVAIVTLIITTITAIYVVLYLGSLFHQNPPAFWLLTPVFASATILMLVSYFRAVCASAGHPSKHTNREFTVQEIQLFKQRAIEQKNKKKERRRRARINADPEEIQELTQITYCDKCELVKRPRVHHCKICDECILRMDHHCPWVGNCVGRNNHKFFILFLLYSSIGLAIVWVSILVDACSEWKYVSKNESDVAVTLAALAGVASAILFLSIGGLLISQVWGASSNMTTLESFVPGFDDRNPFDKGSWKVNFSDIFGADYWLLPTNPQLKSDSCGLGGMSEEIEYRPPAVTSNRSNNK